MSVNEEQRLVEIESKLTYQDHLIETLNEIIFAQQKSIDLLETKLSLLTDRFKKADGEAEIGPANEKPPHY